MIRVVAREKIQSDKKEEALKLFGEMIESTRKEKGCVLYCLNESIDDPCVFAVIEAWESMDDLKAHMESEHFKRLIPQIGACTAEPSRVELFNQVI